MNGCLNVEELEDRWEKALTATLTATAEHPRTYRELKAQAAQIVDTRIDINDYFSTVEKLATQLKTMDPGGLGSIFDIFNARISPSSIWQVKLLRLECKDLLAHLHAFDEWRRNQHHLRIVK